MVMRSRAFLGVAALLFAACSAVTAVWCASMSAQGGMPMPGGWTMSMAWMRMPGQTWLGAAASFLAMWVVMMAAMMLPSLVPMLWRYRQAAATADTAHLGGLTALVGAGYFSIWAVFGLAAFPLGAALAGVAMRLPAVARAVPTAVGAVVLIAGLLQFTAWKARYLASCREEPGCGRTPPADALPHEGDTTRAGHRSTVDGRSVRTSTALVISRAPAASARRPSSPAPSPAEIRPGEARPKARRSSTRPRRHRRTAG